MLRIQLLCSTWFVYLCTCLYKTHPHTTGSCFLSLGVQPPKKLVIPKVKKRSVSYRFTASPTSGVTYKVIFTHQRTGIPQPKNRTFSNSRLRLRKMSGLIPDVTYRLQVVAVLRGAESAAISKDFTTLPDGKTAVTATYMQMWLGIKAPRIFYNRSYTYVYAKVCSSEVTKEISIGCAFAIAR